MQVLIVDDNNEAAQTLALLLQMYGAVTEVVNDGEAALGRAMASPPDAVILDIELPEMDGYELARQMREQLGARTPRLIALTGHGQAEDRKKGEQAGIDVYLVKPVGPEEVVQAITPGSP